MLPLSGHKSPTASPNGTASGRRCPSQGVVRKCTPQMKHCFYSCDWIIPTDPPNGGDGQRWSKHVKAIHWTFICFRMGVTKYWKFTYCILFLLLTCRDGTSKWPWGKPSGLITGICSYALDTISSSLKGSGQHWGNPNNGSLTQSHCWLHIWAAHFHVFWYFHSESLRLMNGHPFLIFIAVIIPSP